MDNMKEDRKRRGLLGLGLVVAMVPLSAVAAGTPVVQSESESSAPVAMASGETLEVTEDNCGRAYVLITDTTTSPNKVLSIPKGGNVIFKPISRKFSWYCAEKPAGKTGESTKEWTTCASGTDTVRIVRSQTGREIRWHCMD